MLAAHQVTRLFPIGGVLTAFLDLIAVYFCLPRRHPGPDVADLRLEQEN